jgi:DNA repair protein RecO (recombination protein O)
MDRNTTDTVLVLSLHSVGEDSRLATCISPYKGTFTAMVFGGRKGKLKSLVSPYHSGKMWLYSDNSKKTIKVQDFDVTETRPAIRENLYKTCAAALGAELIIRTSGITESEKTFTMIKGFLDGLNLVNENSARVATLRFLWRYLDFMGLQPDCFSCVTCLNSFTTTQVAYYSASENGFLCSDCASNTPSGLDFPISTEALYYLQIVTSEPAKESQKITLSINAYNQLHELLYFLIENAAETRLYSIVAGKEIL